MTGELLLEIGTEEIPSDYLDNGLAEMKRLAEIRLKDNRIQAAEPLITLGTPRRLVLIGRAIAEKQEDAVQEVTGPPRRPLMTTRVTPPRPPSALRRNRESPWRIFSSWKHPRVNTFSFGA